MFLIDGRESNVEKGSSRRGGLRPGKTKTGVIPAELNVNRNKTDKQEKKKERKIRAKKSIQKEGYKETAILTGEKKIKYI